MHLLQTKQLKMIKTSTYEKQQCLPRLPIPTLNETLEKFLCIVEPLLSKSSMQQTREEVATFLANDGPKLQSLLEAYDKEGQENDTHGSYIEEMWSNAYLAPDTSVVLNLNPFFLLEEDPDARIGKNQILRAASLTFHSLRLAASLRNETLVPDSFKGTTLCMDQFRSLFGSCRVPMAVKDMVEVDLESDHVLVLYRNQFYYFRALWAANELDGECKVAVDESDIIQILSRIVQDGKSTPLEESIENALGALTSLPRKMWAVTRSQLIEMSEQNASVFDIIDTALFVLVLDDYVPENVHDAAANMLHGTHFMKKREMITTELNADNHESNFGQEYMAGTCCNRWYDKLQIIVCSDGSAGVNFEHSAIDGHTALRFASDVFAETIVTFAKSITKSIYTKECPIPRIIHAEVERAPTIGRGSDGFDSNPVKISFDLHGKIKERIFHAETALGDAISADDTHVLEFSRFGKLFIVGNKLSPDSLVQASIQIAYYRLYGDIVCAYESVLTKRFYHGRTEAARSTTSKSVELCKCWMNVFSSNNDKVKALREATVMHSKLVSEASEGRGVDRHLYALKCIAEMKGIPVPAFFSSDAWIALNHTILSTSNCGNPALKLFGFGPVVPDGFGIGYIIKDNSIHFSISSKHRQTRRFSHALNETLVEIFNLLEPVEVSKLSHHSNVSSKQKKAVAVNGSTTSVEFSDAFDDTYGEKTLELKQCESTEYTKLSSVVRAHSMRSSTSTSMRSSFVGLAKPMSRR